MGYTKLFSSIVASTIWREDVSTKVLWVTMLAMKNERHIVEGSVPGLAHLAGVSLEQCSTSLKKLESPDPYSRNQEHEGRRIEPVDGGWLILNGEYYRKKMSLDERREYQRIKQAQYRHEKKMMVEKQSELIPATASISEKPSLEKCIELALETGMGKQDGEAFYDHYSSNGWKVGRNAMKDIKATMRNWKRRSKDYGNKNTGTVVEKRVDRAIGTANEGTAHLYKGLGKVPGV